MKSKNAKPSLKFRRTAMKFLDLKSGCRMDNWSLIERVCVQIGLRPMATKQENYRVLSGILRSERRSEMLAPLFDGADWIVAEQESYPQSQKDIDQFYDSWAWKRCRYDFLKEKQRRCECCGNSAADGSKIVVDHIKPIRRYWHLRLEARNLQMLCDDCNRGKGSRDETDWRAA